MKTIQFDPQEELAFAYRALDATEQNICDMCKLLSEDKHENIYTALENLTVWHEDVISSLQRIDRDLRRYSIERGRKLPQSLEFRHCSDEESPR
jgi:hypothetical protein